MFELLAPTRRVIRSSYHCLVERLHKYSLMNTLDEYLKIIKNATITCCCEWKEILKLRYDVNLFYYFI